MFITAYAPYGAEGIIVRVETDIRRGIPGIDITGLADGAVKESRERVRAAFRNSGLHFPLDRVLINLAPAGFRKEGAALDLPVAVSVMAAAGLVPGLGAMPEQLMVLGELELSGRVRPVRGVLAAAAAGLREGIRFFIVPKGNEEEAAILLDGNFAAVSTLEEAAHSLVLLATDGSFPPAWRLRDAALPLDGAAPERAGRDEAALSGGDFAEVQGQEGYKRALEIAAAGGHNLLVFGPPGSGKTMLARRLPSIMANLTPEEAVEVTRLHSLAGLEEGRLALITRPPFRSPHHSASAEGILGGGKMVRPGEITLAHLGVLFLDEAPEFRSNVLQSLREPLEDGVITLVRAERQMKLPADFQLVLAANACPCGRLGGGSPDYYDGDYFSTGSPAGAVRYDRAELDRLGAGSGLIYDDSGDGGDWNGGRCFCSAEEIHRYWRKFSGALLDRIELRVPAPPPVLSAVEKAPESSARIAERVAAAVERQRRRFEGSGCRRNAQIPAALTSTFCPLTGAASRALHRVSESLGLSGRGYHGVLKTARTIADLAAEDLIGEGHILEAAAYRRRGEDPFDILAQGGIMPV